MSDTDVSLVAYALLRYVKFQLSRNSWRPLRRAMFSLRREFRRVAFFC